MTRTKVVVDTSVIAEHLTTDRKRSYLRDLAARMFCYTTVFNAIELFAAAKSPMERQAVQDAMDALKVLGINPKSAKNIGAVVSSTRTKDMTALIAAVCLESKLPLATLQPKRYKGFTTLQVIDLRTIIQ
jgi:predicted nucleic acid-binding protein